MIIRSVSKLRRPPALGCGTDRADRDRGAIFALDPEAHPPDSASQSGSHSLASAGKRLAACSLAEDGLATDHNDCGPVVRAGLVLRVHGHHQAHPEAQQGCLQ